MDELDVSLAPAQAIDRIRPLVEASKSPEWRTENSRNGRALGVVAGLCVRSISDALGDTEVESNWSAALECVRLLRNACAGQEAVQNMMWRSGFVESLPATSSFASFLIDKSADINAGGGKDVRNAILVLMVNTVASNPGTRQEFAKAGGPAAVVRIGGLADSPERSFMLLQSWCGSKGAPSDNLLQVVSTPEGVSMVLVLLALAFEELESNPTGFEWVSIFFQSLITKNLAAVILAGLQSLTEQQFIFCLDAMVCRGETASEDFATAAVRADAVLFRGRGILRRWETYASCRRNALAYVLEAVGELSDCCHESQDPALTTAVAGLYVSAVLCCSAQLGLQCHPRDAPEVDGAAGWCKSVTDLGAEMGGLEPGASLRDQECVAGAAARACASLAASLQEADQDERWRWAVFCVTWVVPTLEALHVLRFPGVYSAASPVLTTEAPQDPRYEDAASFLQPVALLRLVANATFDCPLSQELLRTTPNALAILLSHCFADIQAPLQREAAVFVVRALTDGCSENQEAIKELLQSTDFQKVAEQTKTFAEDLSAEAGITATVIERGGA
mmetsp:Transcript_141228/g.316666  ORF Transcript_141228/g.316666 Transcript_141228/m.316666 type:complete len:563 (+) Transcript_141228:34-1722(+)